MRETIEVDSIFGRIEAYRSDLITKQIISFGAHTRPELAFLLSFVHPGDDVFDVGGHIGTFALPLAQKVGPHGRVLVVEGNSENFEILCRNIERLALSHVLSPVRATIGIDVDRYESHDVDGNTGASFFLSTDGPDGAFGVGLDDFLVSHFSPRVVKIDIEGFEAIALRRAPNLLEKKPIIYIEIAAHLLNRNGSSVEEVDQLLRAHNYRLFRNFGQRNGRHDEFFPKELSHLTEGGDFFDALAIHSDDPRVREFDVRPGTV